MVKIIKQIATAILFIICGMFIFRCCMVADKSIFDELFATDTLVTAYADGDFAVKTVKVEKEIAEEKGISINTALGRMRYGILNMRKMAQRFDLGLSL